MEDDQSKEYVVKLLKQLEELKRKKAQKEKKLQKLKKVNIEGSKSQSSKVLGHSKSYTVSDTDNSFNVRNSCTSADEFKNGENNFSSASKCSIKDNLQNNKVQNENQSLNTKQLKSSKDAVIPNVQLSKFNEMTTTSKNIENSSDTTLTDKIHMQNSVHAKSNFLELKSEERQKCHKYESLCYESNNVNNNKIEKPNVDVCDEQLSQNICDIKDNKNGATNLIFCDGEKKSAPSSIFEIESFVSKSSNCINDKIVDNVNGISSCKRKSPDILDESLNSNMSCFLSTDLFSAIDDKKENIEEKKLSSVCTEKSIPVESIDINTSVLNMPSPIIPVAVMSKSITTNTEDFNFPKFSTPTSGIFLSSSNENPANLSKNCMEENPCLSNVIKTVSRTTEGICTLKEAHEDDNHLVFNTSHISSILGKGLSSVLDAHYQSPKKPVSIEKRHSQEKSIDSAHKRRKLFSDSVDMLKQQTEMSSNIKSRNLLKDISEDSKEADKDDLDGLDFDNIEPFHSDSFSDNQKSPAKNSSDDVQPQISKTINERVIKVSEYSYTTKCSDPDRIVDEHTNNELNKSVKDDSELLVVPETEGLFLSKDEDFLESLTLSQHLNDCGVKDNLLNASSQSRLESPVVNQIVAAVKKSVRNSNFSGNTIQSKTDRESSVVSPEKPLEDSVAKLPDSSFDNSLVLDTSYLEDGSQMLGNYKHIPFNCEKNIQKSQMSHESKVESNLSFICSLDGASNEAVIDVEMVTFNNSIYAFIQQKTQIHVWRQEKNKEWIKIFNHQIEDMLSLLKICVTMDDDNLVIVLLLSNDEQYCLQFLLFEKDARIIKLMENTHWLEDRCTDDSVLLCGLDRLMFATAQVKDSHEVSLHAFISLKDCPRLMTAVLGLTDNILCSLCKIKNLPNALLGISESVVYVWHILEARLVTSVSLHPSNYLPIQQCFWATVENGLIFMLTTCKCENKHHVCQLLAANLATGFCQVVMTYSTQPSGYKVTEITKAVYREPFIVVSHMNGALLWSVSEEYCCAALLSKSDVTSVAISEDFENWGLIIVGSKRGFISCYGLKA